MIEDFSSIGRRPLADLTAAFRCYLGRKFEAGEPLESLITWGQSYLPTHFSRPPSRMHHWISEQIDPIHIQRGTKLNVIGPRGGAKSTLVTLAYVLLRGSRGLGTLSLDCFRYAASGLRPSGKHQDRTFGK